MDPFVEFTLVVLDASDGTRKVAVVQSATHRERVDLIARQFHAFLMDGDQSDTSAHGIVLTSDFKLRRQVSETAGWLAFMVDRGDGNVEKLEEAALVVFARGDDRDGREALRKLEPYINLNELPPAPVVVAVKLARSVPLIVSEWYGKSVAGFFAE